jgi:hypothetical protein
MLAEGKLIACIISVTVLPQRKRRRRGSCKKAKKTELSIRFWDLRTILSQWKDQRGRQSPIIVSIISMSKREREKWEEKVFTKRKGPFDMHCASYINWSSLCIDAGACVKLFYSLALHAGPVPSFRLPSPS